MSETAPPKFFVSLNGKPSCVVADSVLAKKPWDKPYLEVVECLQDKETPFGRSLVGEATDWQVALSEYNGATCLVPIIEDLTPLTAAKKQEELKGSAARIWRMTVRIEPSYAAPAPAPGSAVVPWGGASTSSGGGAGGGAAGMAAGGSSASSADAGTESSESEESPRAALSTIVSERSAVAEQDAQTAFFRIAHEQYPKVHLDGYQSRLLDPAADRIPISREFLRKDYEVPFDAAKAVFINTTLKRKSKKDGGPPLRPFFGKKGAYTNRDYDKVEVDVLLKLPAGLEPWHKPSAASGQLHYIAAAGHQELPPPKPAAGGSSASASAVAVAAASSTSTVAVASRFSAEYYPIGAETYVVGEVYNPLLGSKWSKQALIQKFVQAERILQFLKAKEGKASVRDCVHGCIFMAPHLNERLRDQLYQGLKFFQSRFPCLWELQQHRRLLAYQLVSFKPAIANLKLETELSTIKEGQTELKQGQTKLETKLEEGQAKLETKLEEGQAKLETKLMSRLGKIASALGVTLEDDE